MSSDNQNRTQFETLNHTALPKKPSGLYLLTVTSSSASEWQWDNLLPQHPWLSRKIIMLQRKPAGQNHIGYAMFYINPDFRIDAPSIIEELKRLGYKVELNVSTVDTSL